MLLWLSHYLSHYYHGFHVFQYLTLRAILGTLTALFISLLVVSLYDQTTQHSSSWAISSR